MSKYNRTIKGVDVDVYDILKAFNVCCPATQHAVKKLLMPGDRGAKDTLTDLGEAKQSIDRAIELLVPESITGCTDKAPKLETSATCTFCGGPIHNRAVELLSPHAIARSFCSDNCKKQFEK